jgi:hypothetical protein
MPSTINGLIVFLIALIPGVPGEALYSLLAGRDWREDQLRRVIRIVMISVFGLLVYFPIAHWTPLPMPRYVVPSALANISSDEQLIRLVGSYVGHMTCAALVGAVLVPLQHALSSLTDSSTYPSAWDDLLRVHVPGRWVIVSLKNGDGIMGILETAEREVSQDERDILLKEPAFFDSNEEAYISVPYQYLFLPAALIESVAVVYDTTEDMEDRRTPVNQPIQIRHAGELEKGSEQNDSA